MDQNHSYDPGYIPEVPKGKLPSESVVWVARLPVQSVGIFPTGGTAFLQVRDLPVFDWTTNPNSFLNERLFPKIPATVSFSIRWSNPARRVQIRDKANNFFGVFVENTAVIEWSAKQKNFQFTSDPARTSANVFSEVGIELNGVFFPPG